VVVFFQESCASETFFCLAAAFVAAAFVAAAFVAEVVAAEVVAAEAVAAEVVAAVVVVVARYDGQWESFPCSSDWKDSAAQSPWPAAPKPP